MTDARAEVVVVGLGAAGAAILLQLARRGVRAIGIDRFAPPHAHGSTHGDTRITRLAIGEGDAYTPLVKRSHAVWRELEAETGMELLAQNGGLVLESPSAHHPMHNRFDFLDRTIAGARTHGIEHEVLDAAQVSQRFPQFALDGDERAYYEPGAGFVRPERCVAAQLEVAQRLGAQVHVNETVTGIADHEVRTAGATYRAGTVVLAAGPWLATLVSPALSGLFTVYPQVLTCYALRADAIDHGPSAMPVYIWGAAKNGHFYGFPAVDGVASGLKAATESFEHPTTADTIRGDVAAAETDALFTALVGPRLPGL